MNTSTSLLEEELAELNAQVQQTQQTQVALEKELRLVEAELETFAADRKRFDALRDVCNALDKLGELKADDLFWEGVVEAQNIAGHVERARSRVVRFEGEISGILEKRTSLQKQINNCIDELNVVYLQVRDAHTREARRQEEYVVEREVSAVPYHAMVMPWSRDAEDEKNFRRALLIALLVCICLSTVLRLWILPPPPRPVLAAIPERLVSMLRKEPPKPVPPRPKEEKKPEQEKTEKPKENQPKPTTAETEAARKVAKSSGVLAFSNDIKDLMNEASAPGLGSEARLSNQGASAGQARASRSIISMQSGGGSSGGISNSAVSRNVGNGGSRVGGVGFAKVESSVAGLTEKAKPLSSGAGPSRTDEEIQIVFDKYKAALYRMYNTELRKNPTLRGKIILRITIEPGGEVSACTVQSSDLASPQLVAQIVERVKKFNFGPKEKVSKTTITYPIDFLPGG